MSRRKTLILIFIALVVCTAIILIPTKKPETEKPERQTVTATTTAERIEYFALHGWEVEEIAGKDITVPEDFSEAYEEYAVLQDRQGLPLRDYAGKNARIYVYDVRNYSPEDRKMSAELLVCEGTAIASMIYSEDGGSIRLAVS
ncbi:MAG: DUF4830 domain-containing protein [Ruminococcus sp.]|nr:DUF4830 domain-containing protein [Ruminococcus sp.]